MSPGRVPEGHGTDLTPPQALWGVSEGSGAGILIKSALPDVYPLGG